MSTDKLIEHYNKNFKKLVKKFTFKTGTQWAAEDVVQSAYTNAVKYLKSFKEDGEFNKWFNAILNNCFSDWRNLERGGQPTQEPEEELVEPSGGLVEDVRTLISKQSQEHQEILNLYFGFEYTPRDISMVTPNTYTNCHKVIQRFKEEIKRTYDKG